MDTAVTLLVWVFVAVLLGRVSYLVRSGIPLDSHRTFCWQIHLAARRWPWVGLIFGYASALVASHASTPATCAWFLVLGHIFISMRDER